MFFMVSIGPGFPHMFFLVSIGTGFPHMFFMVSIGTGFPHMFLMVSIFSLPVDVLHGQFYMKNVTENNGVRAAFIK